MEQVMLIKVFSNEIYSLFIRLLYISNYQNIYTMDSTVIFLIAGIVILIGAITWLLIARLRKDAWEGSLIDKREETSSGGNDIETTSYVLYVKTTEGKTKRSYVRQKQFNSLQVGDYLIKAKGKLYPEKVAAPADELMTAEWQK